MATIAQKEKDYLTVWSECLNGFKPEEINIGLIKTTDLEFPPSIGEFKKLCRTPKHKTNANAYRPLRSLPYTKLKDFKTDTPIARREMAKIRKILGMQEIYYDDDGKRLAITHDE